MRPATDLLRVLTPRQNRLIELTQNLFRLLPADTCVRDALTANELIRRRQLLIAFFQIAFNHDPHDAVITLG